MDCLPLFLFHHPNNLITPHLLISNHISLFHPIFLYQLFYLNILYSALYVTLLSCDLLLFSLTLNSCLNISEKIDKLKDISEAEINIVVRPEGIKAAKYLEKYCGIPYIIANFYGLDNIKNTLEKIGNILKKSKASYLILEEIKRITEAEIVLKRKLRNRKLNVCISGNYFEACGLCSLLENDLNILVKKIIINHKITTLHTEHYKAY